MQDLSLAVEMTNQGEIEFSHTLALRDDIKAEPACFHNSLVFDISVRLGAITG